MLCLLLWLSFVSSVLSDGKMPPLPPGWHSVGVLSPISQEDIASGTIQVTYENLAHHSQLSHLRALVLFADQTWSAPLKKLQHIGTKDRGILLSQWDSKLQTDKSQSQLQTTESIQPPKFQKQDILSPLNVLAEEQTQVKEAPNLEANEGKSQEDTTAPASSQILGAIAVVPTTTHATGAPNHEAFHPKKIDRLHLGDSANPLEQVEIMQPMIDDKLTNTGELNLKYQLKVPSGRQGIGPKLEVVYGSTTHKTWLGTGWNLQGEGISEIIIDTRRGSPLYDPNNETESYELDGAKLAPFFDQVYPPLPRVANRPFVFRIEGKYDSITRMGTSPQNYWWQVIQTDGIILEYGKYPNCVLTTTANNIVLWKLCRMFDRFGNYMQIDYAIQVVTGYEDMPNLYLSKITYTGNNNTNSQSMLNSLLQPNVHAKDQRKGIFMENLARDALSGQYVISFVSTSRHDITFDCKCGLCITQAFMLQHIYVEYQSQTVRSYDFNYASGVLNVTLLMSIIENDAKGTKFDGGEHKFTYFDDLGSQPPLHPSQTWHTDSDVNSGTAIRTSTGISNSFHQWTGTNEIMPDKYFAVGYKVGGGASDATGVLDLVDLDGDTLPDKVWKSGSNVFYRKNYGNGSFSNANHVKGLSGFSASSNSFVSQGPEVYLGLLNGVLNFAIRTSQTTIYWCDVNGDGFIDVVDNGVVLFNYLDNNGLPTFTSNSELTPLPIPPGSTANASSVYSQLEQQMFANWSSMPAIDTLLRWTAPFKGIISLTNTSVQAITVSASPNPAIRVAIQHSNNEIWSKIISSGDNQTYFLESLNSISVDVGDQLYFRQGSTLNGGGGIATWNPIVQYTQTNDDITGIDANGKSLVEYALTNDYALVSGTASVFQLQYSGSGYFVFLLSKPVTTDDIVVAFVYQNATIIQQVFNSTQSGVMTYQSSLLPIVANSTIAVQVLVESRIDLTSFLLNATFEYQFELNGTQRNLNLTLGYSVDLYTNLLPPLANSWVPLSAGPVTIEPNLDVQPLSNFSLSFTIKSQPQGQLLMKNFASVVNGFLFGMLHNGPFRLIQVSNTFLSIFLEIPTFPNWFWIGL